MERLRLLLGKRLATFHPGPCDDEIRRRTARWIVVGWSVSLLLGFLGPLRRAILHTPGSGAPAVYAAVLVMAAVMLLTWRRPQAFFSALLMSAGGLGLGGSLAFVSWYSQSHRGPLLALGAKWFILGIVLTATLVGQMRHAIVPPPELPTFPDFEAMTPEEVRTFMEDFLAELRPQVETYGKATRMRLVGGILVLLGGGLILISTSVPGLPAETRSTMLAVLGTVLLVAMGGASVIHRRRSVKDRVV